MTARSFLDAVVRQLAYPLGPAAPEPSPALEHAVEAQVAELLELAVRHPAGAAERLAADPVLLAVFFQNSDLLYAHGHPGAAAVGAAVLDALGLLEAREP